jgi:hypothetical protein
MKRNKLESLPPRKAAFIEPMECTPVSKLIDRPDPLHTDNVEIKFATYTNRSFQGSYLV